uniref:Elongin A, like n=1 Tax=Acanthochromis polyacanthus TaxID=80966 RepID=A0A3Q1GQE6_9TELE
MACSSPVVKKVMRCKLQLSASAEPATVLKILQKLKDLDITLDILAETGIGKTVNSFRRHEQAGELAKSLIKGWKKLVPKDSTSHGEDGCLSETVLVKQKFKDRDSPDKESWAVEGGCFTSYSKNQDSSDEALFETGKRRADSEKERCEKRKRKTDKDVHNNKGQRENQNIFEDVILIKKSKIQENKTDNSAVSKRKKNCLSEKKTEDRDSLVEGNLEDTPQKSRFDSVEKRNPSKESKGPFSFECSDESRDKMLKQAKDDRSSGISRSPKPEESKKKMRQEKHNKKTKTKDKESKRDQEEPSMSFESCLNYDVNVFKRKEQSGVKKPPKKIKMVVKHSDMKPVKSPMFQESVMHLLDIPLPPALPEIEKPSTVEYFDRKGTESAVFTGQRLNRKMQVYSGAKTTFLPAMLSLYQQCIRTLQNNINLLYETGGVPFELLEPVLERCTPEQLQRIEECNPIYIGVTDHLWGKHCEKDFKDAKLQEYESWKEMYIRLSEERERKLQRLTKTIVLAHSKKPKGGCCTPRTVPLLNETIWDYQKYAYLFCCLDSVIFDLPALCSLKFLNVVLTGVAPMMAKSLKAFKKQLGRR